MFFIVFVSIHDGRLILESVRTNQRNNDSISFFFVRRYSFLKENKLVCPSNQTMVCSFVRDFSFSSF